MPLKTTRLRFSPVAFGRCAISIAVAAALISCGGGSASGKATLSWLPPTRNADGSPMTDLAGFYIYYGTSPQAMTHAIQVRDPRLTDYTIMNLSPGKYYFSVGAYTASGAQSGLSPPVSKFIPVAEPN